MPLVVSPCSLILIREFTPIVLSLVLSFKSKLTNNAHCLFTWFQLPLLLFESNAGMETLVVLWTNKKKGICFICRFVRPFGIAISLFITLLVYDHFMFWKFHFPVRGEAFFLFFLQHYCVRPDPTIFEGRTEEVTIARDSRVDYIPFVSCHGHNSFTLSIFQSYKAAKNICSLLSPATYLSAYLVKIRFPFNHGPV